MGSKAFLAAAFGPAFFQPSGQAAEMAEQEAEEQDTVAALIAGQQAFLDGQRSLMAAQEAAFISWYNSHFP